MPPPSTSADVFRYEGYAVDPEQGTVSCSYHAGAHTFTEHYAFPEGGDWERPGVAAAVRILFLLAAVSYYKTSAPPVIDLGTMTSTSDERAFLRSYFRNGLGEFAYRNGIDLSGITVTGPDDTQPQPPTPSSPADATRPGRPLIPFGGGIDSIVTVESLRPDHPGASLFVVHPANEHFAVIEEAAAQTGLPVLHVARTLDPKVRRSAELGFLNGHVPITAVITAAAVVAAALTDHDAVVLSNEWSASVPTLVDRGNPINHQWSKGVDFEQGFAQLVATRLGSTPRVFSYLRPRSELWVAQQFAGVTDFHHVFRSCNRAFHQDPAQRLDHWCGRCDKCCFIDLILAPFMNAEDLGAVFEAGEPLLLDENEPRFDTLVGLQLDAKPFECVGDVDECRAAVTLAAARDDRRDAGLLQALERRLPTTPSPVSLLTPRGSHYIPDRYVPEDLLVRSR
jgi:hypothetical protein